MHHDKRRGTGAVSSLPSSFPPASAGALHRLVEDSTYNPLARREPQQGCICFPPAPKASAKS